jgi:hypothetical protein
MGAMTTHSLPDLLRSEIAGRVVVPGDAGWDEARRSWNTSVDQHPAAVVEATSVADVQATVRHARGAGLRVAPQATGHGSEALGLTTLRGAILLRTSGLDAVVVDPATRRATVGAGARADTVADVAGAHGLAPVLGLAASVGVAGLSLGGGVGWLSRLHGLAANQIVALDVVTAAAGDALRVDAEHEPDLFWALRGGGGRFAIVTGLEVALHPVAGATAGMVAWPAERTGEVLELLRGWAPGAPDHASAVLRVLSLPPLDVIPEPIRGRRIVALVAAHIGPAAEAQALLAPLRDGVDAPLMDTFGPVAAADLPRVAGDPEEPGPARGDGFLLDAFTPELAAAFAALVADDAVAALSVMELRQLGGAVGRSPSDGGGALSSFDAGWSFFAGGFAGDDGARAAVETALADVRTRLAPWIADRALLSSSSGGIDPATGFDPQSWERLVGVRDAYDPDRVILANHDGA